MPERDLTRTWFDRLDAALELPAGERASAIEEIRAHVDLAAADAISRGVPRDVATRQAVERLGAPERLARDITTAHRSPLDLLTAAGVAFRVTVVTGFKAFVLAWVAIIVVALTLGALVAGLRHVLGAAFLQVDWSPLLDGLSPAVIGAVVAYAIGRAIVRPIAIAAHRDRRLVRWGVLAIGVVLSTLIALTAVEARWTVATAIAMGSLPAWFALGVARGERRHTGLELPGGGRAVALVAVVSIVLSIGVTAIGGSTTSVDSVETEAVDPTVAYAAVGRFVDLEHPPLEMAETTEALVPWGGPGPIHIERSASWTTATRPWTDLRLEVWPGPEDQTDPNVLDPRATAPLATAPMTVSGDRVHGSVTLQPQPIVSFYYVALTGLTPDGERVQLAWPNVEWWQWRGTVLEYAQALAR